MTGEQANAGAAPTPNTTKPKRTAAQGSEGGGSYLKPSHIGPRGREFLVNATTWEENYAKDALIPCLHLDNGEEDDLLFKITTKGNNKALDAVGAGGEDLTPMEGATIYVSVHNVTARDGTTKPSIQIGQVIRAGTPVWEATSTKA